MTLWNTKIVLKDLSLLTILYVSLSIYVYILFSK